MEKFGDGISWEVHGDQVLSEEKEICHKGEYQPMADAVALIKTDTPILQRRAIDCGSHIGRWVDTIQKYIPNYMGVDQSQKALDVLKKNRPTVQTYHCMLWEIPFKEEFDFACTIAVLQHNKHFEQEKIVPRIFDALKGGGVYLMSESTIFQDTATQRTHENWISMIEKTGFKFIKSMHTNELGFEDTYIFIKP